MQFAGSIPVTHSMSTTNTISSNSTGKKSLYILYLEDENYYVGASANLTDRLPNHSDQNKGAEWTKEHPAIVPLLIGPPITDWKTVEKNLTLRMMEIYGWENVRGGPWTQVNLSQPPTALR